MSVIKIAGKPLFPRKTVTPSMRKLTILVRHTFEMTGDADVTLKPDSIYLTLNIVLYDGLVGEYDWVKLKGRDFKIVKGTKKKLQATFESGIPPGLQYPNGGFGLHLYSSAFNFSFTNNGKTSTATSASYLRAKIEKKIVYEQTYVSPINGARRVNDEFQPQIFG